MSTMTAKPSFTAAAMNRRVGRKVLHPHQLAPGEVSQEQLRREVLEADRLRGLRYSVSLVVTPVKKGGGK